MNRTITMTATETEAYNAGREEWSRLRSGVLHRAELLAHDEGVSVTIETADGIVYMVIDGPYSEGPCLLGAYTHGEEP